MSQIKEELHSTRSLLESRQNELRQKEVFVLCFCVFTTPWQSSDRSQWKSRRNSNCWNDNSPGWIYAQLNVWMSMILRVPEWNVTARVHWSPNSKACVLFRFLASFFYYHCKLSEWETSLLEDDHRMTEWQLRLDDLQAAANHQTMLLQQVFLSCFFIFRFASDTV